LARNGGKTWEERLKNTMGKWQGAYSLVILTRNEVLAVRDPYGFRPLSIGMLPSGGHAAASESCALRTIGCETIREVMPGEIIALSNSALRVQQAIPSHEPEALCTFEQIYFSRPDSTWDGLSIHQVRTQLGIQLAQEAGFPADVVIPVPDSAISAAIGYSQALGLPYNIGFIKNRYIGRTFIEPTDSLRKQGVALKFNVIAENVQDKKVVMIDDSIVRGNTTGQLVRLLRNAGAREVHVRITCPPITHPCFMGVDMGTFNELIAHSMSVEHIRAHIEADSLAFLSLEGMMQAIGSQTGYCNACYTGIYPMEINPGSTKTGFEYGISG
ncbi:MAG TPA: amidophosphoribosyltransferase, partial [Anaerolineales bacterium]